VKRRELEAPEFLERPAAWWQERRPHLNPAGIMALPAFAGMLLAAMRELREDEMARLGAIAAGREQHRGIGRDTALRILWQASEVRPEELE
jgi:hypothetical protein